jgi:hypothetical protein
MTIAAVLQVLAIASNLAIALSYVLIGVQVAPRLVVIAPRRWAGGALRVSGAVFFICCAFTHLELTLHAIATGVPGGGVGDWYYSWHGHLAHHPQAIAGLVFYVVFRYFTSALIVGNHDEYERVLEMRIAERIADLEAIEAARLAQDG